MIRHSENRIAALVLRDAADWAREHGVDETDPFATGPAGGAGKFVGPDGTPWIDEYVAPEYGALRGTSTWEASELIHDALDLRSRFPNLWAAMQQLRIEVRHARRISQACRDLSQTAATQVDAELARKAGHGLPWPRLSKILAAAVINADPALHQAKLAAAKFDRRVWLSESEHGLRNLLIRADQGDQILLYALIERIADILKLDGDTDPVDQRRAKAAGWLGRPEDLVVLLYQHRIDGQPQVGAGSGSASEPGEDRPSSEEASTASPSAESAGRDDSGHNSGAEPCAPIWDSEPPDDDPHEIQHVCGQGTRAPTAGQADSDGSGLRFDLPRLIDYLTTQGLKPVPPRVIMHVHLTDQTLLTGQGVVRSDDVGPLLLTQLTELLDRHHCTISLRPVLDPANLAAVDSYEIPQNLRDAVRSRHPASVFPFSSRTGKHLQLDHTVPHTRTAEPAGQTSITNLGPWLSLSTDRRPPVSGTSNNPTPVSSSGAPRTATTSSSPTTAPKPSDPSPDHARRCQDRSRSRSTAPSSPQWTVELGSTPRRPAISVTPTMRAERSCAVTPNGSAGPRWAPRVRGEDCPGRSTRTRSRRRRPGRRTRT